LRPRCLGQVHTSPTQQCATTSLPPYDAPPSHNAYEATHSRVAWSSATYKHTASSCMREATYCCEKKPHIVECAPQRAQTRLGGSSARASHTAFDAAMNELDTGGVAATDMDTPCATPPPSPITQRLAAVVEHRMHHKLDKWDHTQVYQLARCSSSSPSQPPRERCRWCMLTLRPTAPPHHTQCGGTGHF